MKKAWMALAVLALAVTACKGGEATKPAAGTKPEAAGAQAQAPAAQPVEVVLWHSYREGEKAALEKLVADFNGKNPGIQIRLLNVPYDAFVDKVTIATPRGQGPDLFIFAHNQIGEWVDRTHLLEPISEKVPGDVLKRFIPQTVKALVYKQSLYGLPLAFKSLALFYNPDLVQMAPDTADQLAALGKTHTDKANGRFGLVFEAGLLYYEAPFIHGFGGEILDAQGKPAVGSKATADALAWVRGLVKAGTLPSGVNSAMTTSLFNEGKAAMVVNGPWFLGEIAKDRKFGVAILPTMPGGKRAQPFLGSEAIFLSAFSKHKDEALRVMLALTDDASALVRLQMGRQTVANQAIYNREDVKSDTVIQTFRSQAENSVLMPSRPEMQAVWSTMDMAINQSVFGDTDPAKALADAQVKIEADLSKMAK